MRRRRVGASLRKSSSFPVLEYPRIITPQAKWNYVLAAVTRAVNFHRVDANLSLAPDAALKRLTSDLYEGLYFKILKQGMAEARKPEMTRLVDELIKKGVVGDPVQFYDWVLPFIAHETPTPFIKTLQELIANKSAMDLRALLTDDKAPPFPILARLAITLTQARASLKTAPGHFSQRKADLDAAIAITKEEFMRASLSRSFSTALPMDEQVAMMGEAFEQAVLVISQSPMNATVLAMRFHITSNKISVEDAPDVPWDVWMKGDVQHLAKLLHIRFKTPGGRRARTERSKLEKTYLLPLHN